MSCLLNHYLHESCSVPLVNTHFQSTLSCRTVMQMRRHRRPKCSKVTFSSRIIVHLEVLITVLVNLQEFQGWEASGVFVLRTDYHKIEMCMTGTGEHLRLYCSCS